MVRTRKVRAKSKSKSNPLPRLRPIDYSKKKTHYRLNDNPKRRYKALNEGVNAEVKKRNFSKKKAATAKKARLNILRIYRRNNNKQQCKIITSDMKYLDKKYKLGDTKDIC